MKSFCPHCGVPLEQPILPFCGNCGARELEKEERLPKRQRLPLIWWIVGIPLVVFLLVRLIGSIALNKYSVGSEVVLSRVAVTFASQDDLDRFKALPRDQAVIEAALLKQHGRAFELPSGTHVRILKSDSTRLCIAPLEGDGRQQEGWIELTWLARFAE
jgi:hypothetical protein